MSATPREVFQRLLDGIAGGDRSRLFELYAEDAVVELPFAQPAPGRLVGRDGLRRHFEAGPGDAIQVKASHVRVYDVSDPEVVVAEFDYDVTGPAGTVHVTNVQVMRVRDGLIVESRDYHDHARLASVF